MEDGRPWLPQTGPVSCYKIQCLNHGLTPQMLNGSWGIIGRSYSSTKSLFPFPASIFMNLPLPGSRQHKGTRCLWEMWGRIKLGYECDGQFTNLSQWCMKCVGAPLWILCIRGNFIHFLNHQGFGNHQREDRGWQWIVLGGHSLVQVWAGPAVPHLRRSGQYIMLRIPPLGKECCAEVLFSPFVQRGKLSSLIFCGSSLI